MANDSSAGAGWRDSEEVRALVNEYVLRDKYGVMVSQEGFEKILGAVLASAVRGRLSTENHMNEPTNLPRTVSRFGGVLNFPRRNCVDLYTPAEHAIAAAIDAVERAGASIALTDAVILLGKAKDRVADHAEGIPESERLS